MVRKYILIALLCVCLSACVTKTIEVPVTRVEYVEVPVVQFVSPTPPPSLMRAIRPSPGVVFMPGELSGAGDVCLSPAAAASMRYDIGRAVGASKAWREWAKNLSEKKAPQ